MSFHSGSNSSFDERQWVIQISQSLDDNELEEEEPELPVSIYNVPKALMANDPDSFVPQVIAIGPYHYWTAELYEMQRYKLAAAKRSQKQLQDTKFQHLVEKLSKYEPRIRACYHKYLNFGCDTLGWMMAVDACFLLEFLQAYGAESKAFTRLPSSMCHLIDGSGGKSTHNAIVRDIVKLENQIPLFLLRKMLGFQIPSPELADTMLLSMLFGVFSDLSPFKILQDFSGIKIAKCAHLLDFLYQVLVVEFQKPRDMIEVEEEQNEDHETKDSSGKASDAKKHFHQIWKIIAKLIVPMVFIKRIIFSKPLKVLLQLPWTIITTIPVLRVMKGPIESLFCFQDGNEDEKAENDNSSSKNGMSKPLLMEEITIPSVTDLSEAGVRFLATEAGISSICFDDKTATFYLPTICLDVNSEVVLRNLVAYEACNASGPLVLTRYTELMNGIIDTEEDAVFLRERGIISNRLKSDDEVAKLWNGMSKSVKLTKVAFLDKVIEDVNKYYNGRWKVKLKRFLKIYIFGSWQILTLLAAIFLLLLMTLQAFCSVYSCPRIFHTIEDPLQA